MSTVSETAGQNAAAKSADPLDGATPVMAQFLEMKAAHPGYLLFFRMGDFYELFFDDAVKAADALGIALTKRGAHQGAPIPMCGVPIHNAERYLNDLIRAGFRVAVAEQTEDPAEARKRGAKSVVKRAVVRLVTAGTLTEDALLEGGRHNFLAALADRPGPGAIAWADLSTGVLRAAALEPPKSADAADAVVAAALARVAPREVLLRGPAEPERLRLVQELGALPTEVAPASLRPAAAEARAARFFGVASLEAFGAFSRAEAAALGALIDYLELTQAGAAPMLRPPERDSDGGAMRIDAATRRNLELTTGPDGGRAGSLLATVDRTITGAGARLLAERLGAPSADPAEIARRLDAAAYCLDQAPLRRDLRASLRGAPDVERALSRLHLGRGGPRDLAALRSGLAAAMSIADRLAAARSVDADPTGAPPPAEIAEAAPALIGHEALLSDLQTALVEEPPARLSDGGVIASGYDADLDAARDLRDRARQVIAELQTRYQQEAGVAALKIKHNNVLGYFVETPANHAERMMSAPRNQTFKHRQTMANAVRFSTAELAELESRIARAADRAAELERRAFDALRAAALERAREIAMTAAALARIDVAAAFAEIAETESWVRPVVTGDRRFVIEGGRHPVVEAALARGIGGDGGAQGGAGSFVPNSCDLSAGASDENPAPTPIWVVTGPNMAGKSTFLRQNALIAILAQSGSFVPARRAEIGIVDQLFSRVGASDDLARGRSTFMVEMVETAAILNQAGEKALVILDEIGRGTATYDGLSIAWASLEHLEAENRCRALFATHYHELTTLAAARPAMRNVTVAVREWNGDVVFLREIRPGAADRSYGVQVARLAGLPKSVTRRAEALLDKLERSEDGPAARAARLVEDLPLFAAARDAAAREAERTDAAGAAAPSPVETLLAGIDPDQLTPRQALDALYRLHDALAEGAAES